MKNKKKKSKKVTAGYIFSLLIFLAIGGACGLVIAKFIDTVAGNLSTGQTIMAFAAMIVLLYIVLFVQVAVHEAGHLVGGLLSGYEFSSFRILSFMWLKEDGKIKFRRFSLAGTGGQCLMAPPDMTDGKIPVLLYNFGGAAANLIFGLIFAAVYFVTTGFVSVVAFMFAIVGVAYAVVNGLPMRMGGVDNDGYNALSMTKNADAMRAFWLQIKVNEMQSKGYRLKDMPEEWFDFPSDEAMSNSMVATVGVFCCNRLMDMHDFVTAEQHIDKMLTTSTGMPGLYGNLLICDKIYCRLLDGDIKKAMSLYNKGQQQFMKSMKDFPTVLRTEYVIYLIAQNYPSMADKIKERFEKVSHTYPYPSDIGSEKELMEIGAEMFEKLR